jgi:hypothetical protein
MTPRNSQTPGPGCRYRDVAIALKGQCRFCGVAVSVDDTRCGHCGKRLLPLRAGAAPAKWSPLDESVAAEARTAESRAAVEAAVPTAAQRQPRRTPKGFKNVALRIGVVVAVAAIASALRGSPSVSNYNNRCVTIQGEIGHRRVASVPCSSSHAGRVVAITGVTGDCPEGTDTTFIPKSDKAKTLCIDLDQ